MSVPAWGQGGTSWRADESPQRLPSKPLHAAAWGRSPLQLPFLVPAPLPSPTLLNNLKGQISLPTYQQQTGLGQAKARKPAALCCSAMWVALAPGLAWAIFFCLSSSIN